MDSSNSEYDRHYKAIDMILTHLEQRYRADYSDCREKLAAIEEDRRTKAQHDGWNKLCDILMERLKELFAEVNRRRQILEHIEETKHERPIEEERQKDKS
ncbi:hypothetical protein EG329_006910 [Mollisiaceae sp. DMI_Dod_QoI]|nr:hypothetical protein EG329_006910 [Helotiales sp. DMI_Dod_QoI]